MFDHNRRITYDELYHYGVKGMKWGHRKSTLQSASSRFTKGAQSFKENASKKLERAKKEVSKRGGTELAKRGKSAIDVLVDGDKDWMDRPITSDDATTEARNRGKAALERLMYSEEQVFNKKFYGRYNF